VSIIEVHNNRIHDLLVNDDKDNHEIKLVSCDSHDIFVTNLATVAVNRPDEVQFAFKQGFAGSRYE